MASVEARAMLDALMGSDRNAPLPKGAALPGRKRNFDGDNSDYQQIMKRKRSCYDKDIDPFYTAWGVDVYDLFINTKSNIGTNPSIVDKGAHEEYMNLPINEQEKLGYEYTLFHKLLDLVRQGDRMISRNKEKLKQELSRKLSQRNYQDFVQDVDMAAVEQLTRDMIVLEDMVSDYEMKLHKLSTITNIEVDQKHKLELFFEANRVAAANNNTDSIPKDVSNQTLGLSNNTTKHDNTDEHTPVKEQVGEENDATTGPPDIELAHIKQEEGNEKSAMDMNQQPTDEADQDDMNTLRNELGQLTLQKQRLIFEISQLMALIVPQNDTVESQRRHLNYVKSDISTDKTVCEISGNNMSSRDADERIAAHYSGKQYVGWKLVRDKLQSMIQKYGRNGPPSPPASQHRNTNNNNENMSGRPPNAQQQHSSSSYNGGRGPHGGGGGGGGGSRDYSDRGGGGYRGGGSGGGQRDRDSWVRHGPGGPSGGGGYNHDRRNPPPGDRAWRR